MIKYNEGSRSLQLNFPKWFKDFLVAYKELNPHQLQEYIKGMQEDIGKAVTEIMENKDSKYFFEHTLKGQTIEQIDGSVYYESFNDQFEKLYKFSLLLVNTNFTLKQILKQKGFPLYMNYFTYGKVKEEKLEEMSDFDKAVLGGEKDVIEEMNFKEGLKIIFNDDYDYIVRNGKKFKLN